MDHRRGRAGAAKLIGSAKLAKIRVLFRLGLGNLARVGAYRIQLRLGIHAAQSVPATPLPAGPFFEAFKGAAKELPISPVWSAGPWAFGRDLGRPSDNPPDWDANILTGARMPSPERRWDQLPEFADSISEIKTVWEASRFDWVLAFAQRAANGDGIGVDRLNGWLDDWQAGNPQFCGPNWMCAQEAAIRVMKLAVAARIMGAQRPTIRMSAFLAAHLRRIAPTTSYAIGQANNHATSEAAALFIGGLWLANGTSDRALAYEGVRHAAAGRKLLERAIGQLVLSDGGFAQYSMVYHRLMLDTLSLCALFGQWFGAPSFSDRLNRRLALATDWLDAMILGEHGDVPNIGSNDGAWLLPLGSGAVRDFRPSVALASALFKGAARYCQVASARELCSWLGVELSGLYRADAPERTSFAESGVHLRRAGGARVALVAPRPRFRPHQCDPLHLDLWCDGRPVFCDSGTFSYAQPAPAPNEWLGSVHAHNTVAFGKGEPMPRLGRFLLGNWLKTECDQSDERTISATCAWADMRHRRTVRLAPDRVTVLDRVEGQCDGATLRWRTPEADLALVGNEIIGRRCRLTILADRDVEIRLLPAFISPTYLALEPVQQIEVRFQPEGVTEILTEIELTRS